MITARSEVAPSDPSVPSEESDGIPVVHPVGRTACPVPFHAAAGATARSNGLRVRSSDREATTADRRSGRSRSRAVRSNECQLTKLISKLCTPWFSPLEVHPHKNKSSMYTKSKAAALIKISSSRNKTNDIK